ncbi:MAG TPA: hypothetical protein VER58_15910 [Thermoanaerobaculia bacterium]|nr:hypothetical protein [Thermoanaerobaculia bacterium]
MNRASFASCISLLCGLSLMAQTPKADIATPQPPPVLIGSGTDAQQVLRVVGGKGGNTPNGGQPGAGSSVLIQAGDGGDGGNGVQGNGAGGSIILMPGVAGTGGDITGAPGAVGIGTNTPQKMLSVLGGINLNQGEADDFSLKGALSFGSNSGEAIASARLLGSFNRFGLDFYTGGTRRMSISNSGTVSVVGTLTKGGGSFKIDHPLDPENKYLSHSFVESPDMKDIYDGVARLDAKGEATVELPGWFEALNADFRYQLTAIGRSSPGLYVAEEIHENRFKISGGSPGAKVSWQVTGIRHDDFAEAHRIIVEENKPAAERGKLLYPRERQMAEAR